MLTISLSISTLSHLSSKWLLLRVSVAVEVGVIGDKNPLLHAKVGEKCPLSPTPVRYAILEDEKKGS